MITTDLDLLTSLNVKDDDVGILNDEEENGEEELEEKEELPDEDKELEE